MKDISPDVHAAVLRTVALCKQEVEAVIGDHLLVMLDQGSPWSRAYFKVISEIVDESEDP